MNIIRRLAQRSLQLRQLHQSPKLQELDVYEPDYLEAMKSKTPLYDTLNIQLRGYDYSVLESYQKFVHSLVKNLDINVEDAWAVPHQEIQVTRLKSKSETVETQYSLKLYERIVQITDILSNQLPIVLRALEASTPAGVSVQIVPHEQWHEDIRYVPDTELKALKQELDDLGGPSKKK